MDTRKLSEQTQLLNKLQSDYQAMKMLVQSYEGSLKAVRKEAKYVTNSRILYITNAFEGSTAIAQIFWKQNFL
jgi:hypothetical protein